MSGATLGTVRFGSKIVTGVGITGLRGTGPFVTVRTGRRPRAPDEVVVGSRTLESIHGKVGGTIDAVIDGKPRLLRIVGVAVFPALGLTRFQQTDLGNGLAGTATLFPQDPSTGGTYNFVLLRLRPGSIPALTQFVHRAGCTDPTCIITDGRPVDISGYAKARGLTLAGIGILTAALLIALERALVTAARRRRGEFAVLKAIGMTRRQVASTVGWQSCATALTAIVVGVPLGVALGRVTWAAFASNLGVAPHAIVTVGVLFVAVVGVVMATAVVGVAGAVTARRTRTARELRTA
jgi:hypothetical protein